MGMEAYVTVIDKNLARLYELDMQFGSQLHTLFATIENIEREVLAADLVVGAVLVAGEGGQAAFVVAPGALVGEEVARLLDRGYQKFIKTSKFEAPATATQLHAIHQFTEELKQVTGAMSLYNQSLGTTSDLYEYDRLKGREADQPAPASPSEATAGH
jgi:hypothetical protein